MNSPVRAVVAIGVVLRLVATVGVTPTVYVDSGEYRGVALLGGNRRPWTVPLLHAIVGDGAARVIAHALLGAAAWGALAYTVATLVQHPRLRVVAAGCVMTLGLVSPIVNYDTTITSESVAISLAVLFVVTWLRVLTTPTVARAAAVVAVAVPFAFTRNDHPLLVGLGALVAMALSLRLPERAWTVLAVGLIVTTAWSWYALGRNDEIARFNLALVVANRVVPDVEALEWFTDRGMPLPATVEPEVGVVGGDTVLTFADDRAWNEWARADGRGTYGRWLLTHPDELLLEPWPDLFGLRDTTLEAQRPTTVLLAPGDRYGRLRPVVPEPVESLLWGGGTAAPVLLAGAGLVAAAVPLPRGRWRRLGPARAFAAVGVVVGCGHLLLVWHASTNELGRLAMVAATTIHVSLLVLVAITIDRRLAARG